MLLYSFEKLQYIEHKVEVEVRPQRCCHWHSPISPIDQPLAAALHSPAVQAQGIVYRPSDYYGAEHVRCCNTPCPLYFSLSIPAVGPPAVYRG
jgi:hypothetical protein